MIAGRGRRSWRLVANWAHLRERREPRWDPTAVAGFCFTAMGIILLIVLICRMIGLNC